MQTSIQFSQFVTGCLEVRRYRGDMGSADRRVMVRCSYERFVRHKSSLSQSFPNLELLELLGRSGQCMTATPALASCTSSHTGLLPPVRQDFL